MPDWRTVVCRSAAAVKGLSKQPRTAPVLLGNVARQISGVVAHAPHLDHAYLAPAIEKKMPRRLYAMALHSAPAELQVVRAGSFDQDLRAFHRSGPLGIGANIAQSLLDQRLVALRGGFPKFLPAPVQAGFDVTLRRTSKPDFKAPGAALRHDSARLRIRLKPLLRVDR